MIWLKFIRTITNDNISVLGHSSGGLIACYIASNYNGCDNLILKDAPLVSSNGDRRFNTFNFKDLSTVCHNFINQKKKLILYTIILWINIVGTFSERLQAKR